ncbi:hypothetical protein CEUSTIGMA_g10488.t1 [Chlamydomonas eustigma]|uniref:Phosphatidylglycerophosphatase n=1 Tax=Chlamydomonas eustigma TaxID=1157962 RepID=A0A250XJG8_9CHLO|nr:hypothetical protein CEUSTIGMA_g10488.t1 [Chlamydomonas eustigma]|eukprot:GAX83062.1 hypothetical protein CEUSTIGMA_g10488.t1 [Chlamydomonas eustigma]
MQFHAQPARAARLRGALKHHWVQKRPGFASMASSSASQMGQNFNGAGISLFLQILGGNKELAIPHLEVPDISHINWRSLRNAGYKGILFDKDNTLTEPYKLGLDAKIAASVADCKEVFGDKIVLYSNSAGLLEYDPQGEEASLLEAALGIHVLRHAEKKPAGGSVVVEQYFGCASHELVMVGDRYLTDVVFGNRLGMLTVRPSPLTTQGEPFGVLLARRVEEYFVQKWVSKGIKAPTRSEKTCGSLQTFSDFLIQK